MKPAQRMNPHPATYPITVPRQAIARARKANRFDYDAPTGARPFAVMTEVGPSPWAPTHRLVLVGLKSRPIESDRTPPRNLVFLLDVVKGALAIRGEMDDVDRIMTDIKLLAQSREASNIVGPEIPGKR